MPLTVRNVIAKATIDYKCRDDCPHYMVATCGDDIGLAHREWRRAITRRGWRACSAFSVQMPNTFVAMKGFTLDPEPVAKAKLEASRDRVAHIIEQISNNPDSTADDVVTGKWAWLKTKIINPLFVTFVQTPRPFYADESCKSCGRCARNCPVRTITMENGRPEWKGDCVLCMRCYHYCPSHSIHYGSATNGKGQYQCPGYVLKD